MAGSGVNPVPSPRGPLEQKVWQALETVVDPELPISIVDMGLVYGMRIVGPRVDLELTYTAIGCPAMEMIQEDIRQKLLEIPEILEVGIEVVWSPPWTKARLTERGRQQLQAYGIGL